MSKQPLITRIEELLLLTAFAAGTVDVISFANLGGVFAPAMTGNFALLAYYVAQGDSQSAMGSVIALSGFVVGCAVGVLQRRGRPQDQAISLFSYLFGALISGALIVRKVDGVALLPVIGVACALVSHRKALRQAA